MGSSLAGLVELRDVVARRLPAIGRFVVADITAADYLRRAYDVDEKRVSVIEHGSLVEAGTSHPAQDAAVLEGPLRIAFVGRGWYKKGLRVVNQVANELADAAIEIHHFGPVVDRVDSAVRTHGAYRNDALIGLLREAGIHVVLLPGPYAETYSYVMSEAMTAGLPVIGAGYGALGHRIRVDEVGWTIDPDDPGTVRDLLVSLDRCRPELLRATRNARSLAMSPAAVSAQRHAALYRDEMTAIPRATSADVAEETTAEDRDRLRRHLRALSAHNARLRAQLGQQRAVTRGSGIVARGRAVVGRRAPRIYAVLVAVFEAIETGRKLAAEARAAVRMRSRGR